MGGATGNEVSDSRFRDKPTLISESGVSFTRTDSRILTNTFAVAQKCSGCSLCLQWFWLAFHNVSRTLCVSEYL